MAFDGFLFMTGILGESTDSKYPGWVEIISFKHEASQPGGSATSRAGGRTSQRVDVRDFFINKVIDKSSPVLFKYLCTGQHIDKVQVDLCEAGGDKVCYMRYTFQHCIVSAVKASGTANEQIFVRPIEEVSFNAGNMTEEYVPMTHEGKPGAALRAGWSMELNKEM